MFSSLKILLSVSFLPNLFFSWFNNPSRATIVDPFDVASGEPPLNSLLPCRSLWYAVASDKSFEVAPFGLTGFLNLPFSLPLHSPLPSPNIDSPPPPPASADELSFSDIERNIFLLSEKAKQGKITINDLQGGTFTISNGGIYGSMLSTPILNPPQTGILGMHNIVERPVAKDGSVVIRPIMYLALSYDHRIIDGKDSVSFLKCIKENLEDPRRLFLDL